MTTDIKKLLGITNTTTFDSIIDTYVQAAKIDLISVGVLQSVVESEPTDPLVYSAIVSYCLSLLDSEHAELYANAYALQKDTMRHLGAYIMA